MEVQGPQCCLGTQWSVFPGILSLTQCSQLEKALLEASSLLTRRQQELKDLTQTAKERDQEIDRLNRLLREAPKPVINIDEEQEWKLRFNELQNRHRKDGDNYENELNRKDMIIMELREKLNQLLSQPLGQVGGQYSDSRSVPDDKDGLISRLRTTIGEKDQEIFSLMTELKNRPTVDIVQEPPKVVRVTEPNMREVRYEKDPYLIEQNARMHRELEQALMEEQNAKNDLAEKIKELNRLQALVAELRAMPPKVVLQDKIVTKEVMRPIKIGDRAERLLDMCKRHWEDLNKRLAQAMVYYYAQYMKWRRLAQEKREKVFINQKLEVIDGTFDVWIYLRESMVDWLFEIFVRSADRAAQRTMNSFLLFKCNLEDMKKNGNDFYVMLINVYARLKNLIYDDIPKIVWEQKYEIPSPLPKDKLMNLSPEAFKKLKANQDIRDNINEWVEDTMFAVILRKQYDQHDKDKTLLYLYRLLAIKYRVTYPLKGESFKLDDDLRIVLESKICNAALAYFNSPGPASTKTTRRPIDAAKTLALSGQSRPRSADLAKTGGKSSLKGTSQWPSNLNRLPEGPGYSNLTTPLQPATAPRPGKTVKFQPSGYNSDYLSGGQQQASPPTGPSHLDPAKLTFGTGPAYFGPQVGDANLRPTSHPPSGDNQALLGLSDQSPHTHNDNDEMDLAQ